MATDSEAAPLKDKVRDIARGQYAWARVRGDGEDLDPGGERLLVHSVADRTALSSYLPAVPRFVDFVSARNLPANNWDDIDAAVVRYLTHLSAWRRGTSPTCATPRTSTLCKAPSS